MTSAGPSAYQLKQSSPLETLVRRTSNRRAHNEIIDPQRTPPDPSNSSSQRYPYRTAPLKDHSAPKGPDSPLLHGHFSRGSTATATTHATFDNKSYLDLYPDEDESNYDEAYDQASMYSYSDPPLRDSWTSAQTPPPGAATFSHSGHPPPLPTSHHLPPPEPPNQHQHQHQHSSVPSVVVSVPDVDYYSHHQQPRPHAPSSSVSSTTSNRAPSRVPSSGGAPRNFSRPLAPGVPPIPSEEQKRQVLERNANRHAPETPPLPTPSQTVQTHSYSPRQSSPLQSTFSSGPGNERHSDYRSQGHDPRSSPGSSGMRSFAFPAQPPSPASGSRLTPTTPTGRSTSPSSQLSASPNGMSTTRSNPGSRSVSPSPMSGTRSAPLMQQRSNSSMNSLRTPTSAVPESTLSVRSPHVMLPRGPPSLRPSSPTSVYSNYSYYNLDSASPSPTSDSYTFDAQKKKSGGGGNSSQNLSVSHKHKSTLSNLKFFKGVTTESPKAYEYLQLGIQCHEENKMEDSAAYFEKSAKEEGGSGVGMLMWGLTLRHGWGCTKNEKGGFKWLSKAAESAVADLDQVRMGGVGDPKLLQSELVLAIYEVGQCFFHGWGVQKDQKMAVSYYAVAARLGDSDAQNDLGFCLANGKGCKKDRKEAAKWYRAAVKQGISDIGLAWIYKDKYQ